VTSTSDDMDRHPDVSEISDFTEELLPPERSEAVRHHLGGCALCTDVLHSLEEIRSLLVTLPGSTGMPSDIAERLDAALAAEALLATADMTTVASTAPGTGPFALSSPQEHGITGEHDDDAAVDHAAGSPHVSRETSAARRPAGRPAGNGGPGRSGTRQRRRVTVLSALVGAAAVAAGVLVLQPTGHGDHSDSARSPVTSPPTVNSAMDFSPARLQDRVDALLATLPSSTPSPRTTANESLLGSGVAPAPDNGSTTVSPQTESGPTVPACIRLGTGRTDSAIAAELGTYRGSSAYLVIMRHPVLSSEVQVYVVDARCITSAPATKGKLLFTHSYPRP
jgi:hypothetical protein